MNRITLAANNNFELQTILIAEIETYETLQGTASAAGTSVAGAGAAARTAKKDNVVRVFWDVVVGHIERFQWSYKRWGARLLHASRHVQGTSVAKILLQQSFQKQEEAEQLLEYGWDLNLSSNDPDFVATLDKQVLINRLRQSYHRKGCRFMHLFASFEVDNIDWTGFVVYEVAITTDISEATVVTLRNKLSSDLTNSDDGFATGKFTLHLNWNPRSAFIIIKTVTDTCNCVHFFPMLSRTLKRQASKEDETVAVHRPKYLRGLSPHTGKAATPSRMTQKAEKEDASATPAANSVETTGGGLPVAAQTVLPLPILTDVPPPEVVGVTQTEARHKEVENVGAMDYEKDAVEDE